MKQKKKIINLRLFLIGFIGMIFGILNFYYLLKIILFKRFNFLFVGTCLFLLISIVLCVYCICKFDKRKFTKYSLVFILLFVIGFAFTGIKTNTLMRYKSYDDEVVLSGEIYSHYYNEKFYVVKIKNLTIDGVEANGKAKLFVLYDSQISDELSLGDIVETKTNLNLIPLTVGDKIQFDKYNDTVYSGYVANSNLEIENRKGNFIYSFQERLKVVLDDGLSNQNSDIAYSVLVGDKSELDSDVRDSFSYAGISHVLAVSGLHVGFLVALITFLLNLCRIGRRSRFFITTFILLIYSCLCGFTPSVLRASFMIIILLLAGVLGEEYDGINSLSLAGIIILLISPIQLFSLGFQLSFMCVFMIMTLADKTTRFLVLHNVNSKIATAVSISFCVTLGSSIILANTLHEISIISILSNLIVIPIFSIVYPLLFVLSVLAMIISPLSKLLFVPEVILHFIKIIADWFAGLNFAHFRVFNLGGLLLFVFILFSLVVKYLMINRKIKTPVCSVLFVICLILTIFGTMPIKYDSFALYTNYQYSSNSALITTTSGKTFLIGIDNYNSKTFLTELKLARVDVLVIPDFEVNKIDEYVDFCNEVNVGEILIPKNENFTDRVFKKLAQGVSIRIEDSLSDEIHLRFIKTDSGDVSATFVNINGKNILFTNGITKAKLSNVADSVRIKLDYIVTNKSKYDFADFGITYDKVIHSNKLGFSTNSAISLKNTTKYVLSL